MNTVLLATGNSHKTREVRAILGDGWQVEDLSAHPDWPEVAETGATFAENAALKAVAASLHVPDRMVLADDSGLEVDALAGAPGVYSARYAGPLADDAANRQKLLAELDARGALRASSRARFRCHMAVARAGSWLAGFDGVVEGVISAEERGGGGFGYDALFVPAGFTETFGELSSEVKNRLSHRAAALAQAAAFLQDGTSGENTPTAGGLDSRLEDLRVFREQVASRGPILKPGETWKDFAREGLM